MCVYKCDFLKSLLTHRYDPDITRRDREAYIRYDMESLCGLEKATYLPGLSFPVCKTRLIIQI